MCGHHRAVCGPQLGSRASSSNISNFSETLPPLWPPLLLPPGVFIFECRVVFFFVSFRRRIFLFAAPHALRNFRRSRKRIDLLLSSSFFSLSYLVVLRADVVVHTPHHNLVNCTPSPLERPPCHTPNVDELANVGFRATFVFPLFFLERRRRDLSFFDELVVVL